MKILNIVIVMLVLIMSVGAVCAADDISDEIISDRVLDITLVINMIVAVNFTH